jgi:hypothetical protein
MNKQFDQRKNSMKEPLCQPLIIDGDRDQESQNVQAENSPLEDKIELTG